CTNGVTAIGILNPFEFW
nr:immunoglobulin heavy chain junction region [Macaca mulatta]MOV38656.1 immunoglobulin heavy chain junction region [Macaca mulatta]MOV40658.1 immunoglobulin heavy chain junction region [Macaca mulatta]MOV41077.1 immunoglobulin heavy chain junction region [Macaca mulatta]MOV44569.1 immunoglobulin heavy chain junction region [Macaca mulatta]